MKNDKNTISCKKYEMDVLSKLIDVLNMHAYYKIANDLNCADVFSSYASIIEVNDILPTCVHPAFFTDKDMYQTKPVYYVKKNMIVSSAPSVSEALKEKSSPMYLIIVNKAALLKEYNEVVESKYKCKSFMLSEKYFTIEEMSKFYLSRLIDCMTDIATDYRIPIDTIKYSDNTYLLDLIYNTSEFFKLRFSSGIIRRDPVLYKGRVPNNTKRAAKIVKEIDSISSFYKMVMLDKIVFDLFQYYTPILLERYDLTDIFQKNFDVVSNLYFSPFLNDGTLEKSKNVGGCASLASATLSRSDGKYLAIVGHIVYNTYRNILMFDEEKDDLLDLSVRSIKYLMHELRHISQVYVADLDMYTEEDASDALKEVISEYPAEKAESEYDAFIFASEDFDELLNSRDINIRVPYETIYDLDISGIANIVNKWDLYMKSGLNETWTNQIFGKGYSKSSLKKLQKIDIEAISKDPIGKLRAERKKSTNHE